MRRIILGTAGHIDHGKTALVRALTGVDTDRLPEEKRRGITIDLGFAALSLDGVDIGIVDVPGHEALVRNMLAGATGINVVVLVIAADEGIMPQTREHLAIMDLLEVSAAIVALTKSDLVDNEWLDLVTTDVCDVLSATRFAGSPVVPVSSTTGAGLDALRAAITAAAHSVTERSRTDVLRLPIDRMFTVHGTGTVVTGTVWSGEVRRDSNVWVMPNGAPARVRGLQVHAHARDSAVAGERVALALAVDRDAVRRGDTIVGEDIWAKTMIVTAHVRVLPDAERPLKHRQRVRFHLGTAEILGRVATLEAPLLEPGDSAWVQVRLESPCVARAGDHFVLRSYSPVHTIAGGIIAEPQAGKRKRIDEATAARLGVLTGSSRDLAHAHALPALPALPALRALLEQRGIRGAHIDALPLLLPADREAVVAAVKADVAYKNAVAIGASIFSAIVADHASTALLGAIDQHHNAHPLSPGLPKEALRPLHLAYGQQLVDHAVQTRVADATLRFEDACLARAAFARSTDPAQGAAAREVLEILEKAGLEPPSVSEMPASLRDRSDLLTLLRHLEKQGTAVSLTRDRFIHRPAIDQLIHDLAGRFRHGQVLTTTELKDAIGVSRKYLIPILEYLDREGISRREGDNRTWSGLR